MHIEAIDHVILPVASLDAAAPFERLGLRLTPPLDHGSFGTHNRSLFVGDNANVFYVELMALTGAREVEPNSGNALLAALREPRGLFTVALRVADMQQALADLEGAGIHATVIEVQDQDGRKIADIAPLPVAERAGTACRLVQPAPREPGAGVGDEFLDHPFALKRLDHLAAIAPDLDAATRFWTDVLGVSVYGEIATPAVIIRQMKMGDAIFELLGPATADSPIRQRPPGLISMVAMEAPNLDAAVQQARAAGFTAPDPATGVLPGTRTASIPAAELSGLTLQLLEYV